MRRTLVTLACFAVAATLCTSASAQRLDLPPQSPGGKLTQTVGLTDITIEFSSPAVHGRRIWGDLVPYDQVWRTGANAATKITFSRDVSIGGTAVPKGAYAFFAIPAKSGSWSLILSKTADQPGSARYKKEEDLLRVTAKAQPIAPRERLTYSIDFGFDQTTAAINLEWEKLRVSLPIKLATDDQAAAQIKDVAENPGGALITAATYLMVTKKSPDEAMELIDRALAMKETWLGDWVKAQLLFDKGKRSDAVAMAQKAKTLGDQNPPGFFYKDLVEKALKQWQTKS